MTASPAYWFSSDTAVAAVVRLPRGPLAIRDSYRVVGRRAGTAYIGAGFLPVRDSVQVTVVP